MSTSNIRMQRLLEGKTGKLQVEPLFPPASDFHVLLRKINAGGGKDLMSPNGDNLLHLAIKSGDTGNIRTALGLDISLEATNREGKSPLVLVMHKKPLNMDWVELLVKAGADPHTTTSMGENLVHFAVESDDLTALQRVLNLEVNPEATNREGKTAIVMELEKPVLNMSALEILIQAKANRHAKTLAGDNILHLAIDSKDAISSVQRAISLGINPKEKGSCGKTALEKAQGKEALYEILKQYAADYSPTNQSSRSSGSYLGMHGSLGVKPPSSPRKTHDAAVVDTSYYNTRARLAPSSEEPKVSSSPTFGRKQ